MTYRWWRETPRATRDEASFCLSLSLSLSTANHIGDCRKLEKPEARDDDTHNCTFTQVLDQLANFLLEQPLTQDPCPDQRSSIWNISVDF